MISINDIRSKPEKIKDALKSKGYNGSINDIITIDENFRKLTHSIETLRAKKNNVSEGPGFNIFSVDETGLNTPDHGVLEGITRQTVINLAKELDLSINIKSISIEKFKSSDELFATSTAGGIMPITKINGKPVGSGVPGKITRELHKTYWYKHSDPDWSLSVDDILNK